MKPKARTLKTTSSTLEQMTPTAQDIWSLCDGERDVQQIAHMLSLNEGVVFAELDKLADANLLEARLAPPTNTLATNLPAGMNRREALARLALGAAGGFAALTVAARQGFAQDKLQTGTNVDTSKDEVAPIKDVADAELEKEIAKLEKRVQERKIKRRHALDCRKKVVDKNKVSEEATKKQSCANPGMLQKEIVSDQQQITKMRKRERHSKHRSRQLERHKKHQST